jgi:ABC-2 type transport system ATP-binding protein
VEFDFQVEEQLISKIENLVSYVNIHDMMWTDFKSDKDMRSVVLILLKTMVWKPYNSIKK